MKKVIYKYKLDATKYGNTFTLPSEARVVRFASQNHGLFMWVEKTIESDNVQDFSRFIQRTFKVVGTGQEYKAEYLMSCEQGPFVWHLTEVI